MESAWTARERVDSWYRNARGRIIARSRDGRLMLVELRPPRGPIRVLVAVYDGDDEDPMYFQKWLDGLVNEQVGGWEELGELGVSRIDVWLPADVYEFFAENVPEEIKGVPIYLRNLRELDLDMLLERAEEASRSLIQDVGEINVVREGSDRVERPKPPRPAYLEQSEADQSASLELVQDSGRLVSLLKETLEELRRKGRSEETDERLASLERALEKLAEEIRELKSGSTLDSIRLAALEKRVDDLSRSVEMLLTIVRLLSSGLSISPAPAGVHSRLGVAPPSGVTPSRGQIRADLERREPHPTETVKDLRVEAQPEKPPGEKVSLDLLEEFARDNPWADVLSRKGVKRDEG